MSNLKRVSLYIMYITDLAALLLAFFAAYGIRRLLPLRQGYSLPGLSAYTPLLLGTVVAYAIVAFLLLYNDNFSSRGVVEEILASARMVAVVMALDFLIFYFTKTSAQYSRLYVGIFIVLAFLIDVLFRMFVKKGVIPLYKRSRGAEHLVIATEEKRVSEMLDRLNSANDWRFQITGLILVDCDKKGQRIQDIPVISNRAEALNDIITREVDSVLLALPDDIPDKDWVDVLQQIGKTVYIHLDQFYYSDARRMLDYLGDCAVVSYQPAMPVRGRSLVIKRGLDGVGAVLLLPFVGIVSLITIVYVKTTCKGPVLIGRERIGKNGRRFRMYYFRTMENSIGDIDQKESSRHTGFGRFLRFTHLDGLPMILNVLVGDMSFVGPQAVTTEQIREGNLKTIRNLCTRPGIIGVWSTRQSDGKKADLNEYVNTWSLRLDAKLILKSIIQFFSGLSDRKQGVEWEKEETQALAAYMEDHRPMVYDRSTYRETTGNRTACYTVFKRFFDIVVSLLGIIVLSWLFVVLMIRIATDDGGNPIYRHRRVGKYGKRIMVCKFRSMKQDVGDLEDLLTPEQLIQYRTEFKIDNDPRNTKFGVFLRRSSLDELPQLFNVLGGSMSLVGPRPITEEEVLIYGDNIARLLSVKPGLTGYWQAYARNNATYETGERQQMEMYYVDHRSMGFDLKILLHTVKAVIRQEGAQ